MKTARYTVALLATMMLVLSGCGGGGDNDKKSSGKDSTSQVDQDDVDDAIDDIADGGDIADECKFLLKLALAPGLVASGQLDPTTLEGIDAPDELKDDVEVYVAALLDYVDDPVANAEALSAPDFVTASKHISEYAEENCPDFGK
jgi:hypothetical protein